MLEVFTAGAAFVGALTGLLNSYGLFRLNAKMDRFTGRVEAVENAHNAHVNAPGLHAGPVPVFAPAPSSPLAGHGDDRQ